MLLPWDVALKRVEKKVETGREFYHLDLVMNTHSRKLHSSGLNLVTGHYQLEAGTGEGTPTGQSCAQQTLGATVSDINGKGEDGLGWA